MGIACLESDRLVSRTLVLELINCVTLGTLLNLCEPMSLQSRFLHFWMVVSKTLLRFYS